MDGRNTEISIFALDNSRIEIRLLRLLLLDAWGNYKEDKDQHGYKHFWEIIRTGNIFDDSEFMTLVHVSRHDWREWLKYEIRLGDKILDRLFIIAKFMMDYFDGHVIAFKHFFNDDKKFKKIMVGTKVGEIDREALNQWGEVHKDEIRGRIKYLEDQLKQLEDIYFSQGRKHS